MGVYDMLPMGSQVKCWGSTMDVKEVGDSVPSYAIEYIVLLQEGGFVRVKDGIIVEIVEDGIPRYPEDFDLPCIDKWGGFVQNKHELEGCCMFGYDYYFMSKPTGG
jgi:hypothetical protein